MNPILLITLGGALVKLATRCLWNTKPSGIVNEAYVTEAIKRAFPNTPFYVMNPFYDRFTNKQYSKFIKVDDTDKKKHTSKFNCIVFALITMANARATLGNCAFGTVFTKNHVINCYVNESGGMTVDEPQTDGGYIVEKAEFVLI